MCKFVDTLFCYILFPFFCLFCVLLTVGFVMLVFSTVNIDYNNVDSMYRFHTKVVNEHQIVVIQDKRSREFEVIDLGEVNVVDLGTMAENVQ